MGVGACPSGRSERRMTMRRPCGHPSLPVTAFVTHEFWQTTVHDLSCNGIGLKLNHAVEPGTLVRLGLFSRAANLWYMKMIRVIHATKQSDGSWLVGCVFLQKLTDQQLQELLS